MNDDTVPCYRAGYCKFVPPLEFTADPFVLRSSTINRVRDRYSPATRDGGVSCMRSIQDHHRPFGRWAFMEVRLNRRRRVCSPPYHTVLFIVSLSQLARIACLRETCSRFGLRYYRYLSAFVRNSAHSVNLMTIQFGAAIKISFWDQSYDRRKKECICWKGSKF